MQQLPYLNRKNWNERENALTNVGMHEKKITKIASKR